MNEKIRSHVNTLFYDAPATRRATEFKEELIANLLDRFADLVAQGKSEDEAYAIVIAGIGDVDELIKGLRDQNMFDPGLVQIQRQKSALIVSFAVAIYILSFVFPLITNSISIFSRIDWVGPMLTLFCWAFATGLLVYNALSKPKYVKTEDTIVEDFKEWNRKHPRKKALRNTAQSMLWTLTVIIYLSIGFFFDAWNPGWMVFLVAAAVSQIIRLVFIYLEAE